MLKCINLYLVIILVFFSCKSDHKEPNKDIETNLGTDRIETSKERYKQVSIDSQDASEVEDKVLVIQSNDPKKLFPKAKKANYIQNKTAPVSTNLGLKNDQIIQEAPKKVDSIQRETVINKCKASDEIKELMFDHSEFDELLKKYVSGSGKVNYRIWKQDQQKLNNYIDKLSNAENISNWKTLEQLSFWINTYNAVTIQLILDNSPVKSIKDLGNGKPWDLPIIEVANIKYSLNEIENDIIRKKFSEPRIHFALNCAAKSCPPLSNKAYTKANIDQHLESLTVKFINSNSNSIEKESLKLSNIFNWYKSDFGDILGFISKYSKTKPKITASITYNNYDWSLNE